MKPASKHVGFYLLPVVHHPELVDGLSPELSRCRTGKSVFTFRAMDEGLFGELDRLVARAYSVYMGEGSGAAAEVLAPAESSPEPTTKP